ncbi:MAG TPA: DUF4296 domain-containing protein [Sunxiuqinia sp.]|nr:DUF4296 domain-containing protein [Sunxiuqinia sp.]
MKKTTAYILILFMVSVLFSCKEKKGIPKPDNLIGEKQMVSILYDMHINQAYYNQYRLDKKLPQNEATELYYSVLKKHGVADSTFAKSVVFYSSMPKIYERIYQKVVDRLKMLQEENNEKKEVNIHPEKK